MLNPVKTKQAKIVISQPIVRDYYKAERPRSPLFPADGRRNRDQVTQRPSQALVDKVVVWGQALLMIIVPTLLIVALDG